MKKRSQAYSDRLFLKKARTINENFWADASERLASKEKGRIERKEAKKANLAELKKKGTKIVKVESKPTSKEAQAKAKIMRNLANWKKGDQEESLQLANLFLQIVKASSTIEKCERCESTKCNHKASKRTAVEIIVWHYLMDCKVLTKRKTIPIKLIRWASDKALTLAHRGPWSIRDGKRVEGEEKKGYHAMLATTGIRINGRKRKATKAQIDHADIS